MYASRRMVMPSGLQQLFAHPSLVGVDKHGCAIWFETS
jgi:hypothetical protein